MVPLSSNISIGLAGCGALNVDPFRSVSHCGGGTSLSSSFFKQWYVFKLTMFILVLTCTSCVAGSPNKFLQWCTCYLFLLLLLLQVYLPPPPLTKGKKSTF